MIAILFWSGVRDVCSMPDESKVTAPYTETPSNRLAGQFSAPYLEIFTYCGSAFFFFAVVVRFQRAAEFCPHHLGHYLGMDTHDTHMVSRGLGLHPGMVITVEPGIYISEQNDKVPERLGSS